MLLFHHSRFGAHALILLVDLAISKLGDGKLPADLVSSNCVPVWLSLNESKLIFSSDLTSIQELPDILPDYRIENVSTTGMLSSIFIKVDHIILIDSVSLSGLDLFVE